MNYKFAVFDEKQMEKMKSNSRIVFAVRTELHSSSYCTKVKEVLGGCAKETDETFPLLFKWEVEVMKREAAIVGSAIMRNVCSALARA